MEYVSQAYFRAVQKAMVEAGFALISNVTISTDDVPYHVGGKARSTTLFFHVIGKGAIVQLEYTERLESKFGQIGGYWSIDFYFHFRSVEELVTMNAEVQRKRLGERHWDYDPYYGIPVLNEPAKMPDFRDIGGGSADDNSVHLRFSDPPRGASLEAMPVSQLLRNVRAVTDGVLPYLAQGRMDSLQVTCFPPYYIFPGCEKKFWSRFNLRYLKQAVVRRPWGSDMQ